MSDMIQRFRSRTVLPVLALLVLAGCGDGETPFQVIEETEFAASLGIDLSTMEELPTGVYIQDIELGTGDEAMLGDVVNVDYIGWLADGTEFNNFTDFDFSLDGVIPGFRDGIVGMQAGGTRKMVVPPDQAYGSAGNGTLIPPGAILVFQVTLNSVSAGS
ncbi:MAG: FKBP-type peptidyl-prolyl cis-trans isomerase [Longimicrobiales bacterium]|nr:FKBP-type peptidyl-prolyl cis-trans isomerase [Longimicrobiales bacterium]